MPKKTLLHFVVVPFGIALLLAGLFFQKGTAGTIQPQITVAPTLDRLAEPTLPVEPSQADYGAQVYWLNCSPCHGDTGQGLTDDFRQQYPPEDQNCWKSHCHGNVTYENGFTIPKIVPQLIGSGSLAKFQTAANLFGFISKAMPFQRPGVLKETEYYQIVTFLLRQNKLIDAHTDINASNASVIIITRATPVPTPQPPPTPKKDVLSIGLTFIVILIAFVFILIFTLKKFGNKATI